MAKAKKQTGKEIIIRECVEANAVLPPEATAPKSAAVTLRCDGACVHLDRNADTAAVALVLTTGWHRAQAGLVEIIRFGATLLAVREWLDGNYFPAEINSPKRGKGAYGLKGWLADNCPDINYNTAYGYMCAASGLRREAKLAEDVPLLVMMGEDPVPEARAEKLRKRVQRILSESTLGLLREAASAPQEPVAKGGQRDGAGRPSAKHNDSAVAAGAAWAKIGSQIDRATAWNFEKFLPEAITREALSTVKLLQEALTARLQELGKGA